MRSLQTTRNDARRQEFLIKMRMPWTKPREPDAAKTLYRLVVAQARHPAFYVGGVPDTLEGRYDMLVLHVFAVLRRLKSEAEMGRDLGQQLFDTLFDDMDAVLREIGVGDLSVGKKIRSMAEMFYGRITAYDIALRSDQDHATALGTALARNVFQGEDAADEKGQQLARYVMAVLQDLEAQPASDFVVGKIRFPEPDAYLAPMPRQTGHGDAMGPAGQEAG